MSRAEVAKDLFKEGYACSQAVVLAFSDLINIDKEELTKISLPLGGGLGRLRLTCGAISGMAIVIGAIFTENGVDADNKIKVYEIVQELTKRFEEKYQTIICKQLLENASLKVEIKGVPEQRNDAYYQTRPCESIVYHAALILEQYLIEENIINN